MLEPNIKDTGGMINVLYIAREGYIPLMFDIIPVRG